MMKTSKETPSVVIIDRLDKGIQEWTSRIAPVSDS